MGSEKRAIDGFRPYPGSVAGNWKPFGYGLEDALRHLAKARKSAELREAAYRAGVPARAVVKDD